MKRRNGYPSRAGVALFSMVALAVAAPVAAQGKDDLWVVSSKMDMPGMPMAMPAQVNRVCVGKTNMALSGRRVGDCTAPARWQPVPAGT